MAAGHTFGIKISDFKFYLEALFLLKKPVFLRFFALGACGGYQSPTRINRPYTVEKQIECRPIFFF